jgi:hypothetical protein
MLNDASQAGTAFLHVSSLLFCPLTAEELTPALIKRAINASSNQQGDSFNLIQATQAIGKEGQQ